MAITEVKIMADSPKGTLDTNGGRLGSTASLTYRVKTDSTYMPFSLLPAAQAFTGGPHEIPSRYDEYDIRELNGTWQTIDQRSGIYARDFNIRKDVDHMFWLVDVTWKPLDPGQIPDTNLLNDEDPLSRPTSFWLEFAEETIPVAEAWNVGDHLIATVNNPAGEISRPDGTRGPMTTVIGEDFQEPLIERSTSAVLVFEKNYASLGEIYTQFATYGDSLNDDDFLIQFPKHHARYDGITTTPQQTESGFKYYTGTTRISLRADRPFHRDIAHRGWRYIDENHPTYKVQDWTKPEPTLLTTLGTRLPDATVGNFLTYRTLREVDYSNLVPNV